MAEVLLVSLGSTSGLRASDAELAASLERAGAAAPLILNSLIVIDMISRICRF